MVITLSRQAECGGELIARLLCERAGLRLADRAVLERMAEREGPTVAQLAVFDEVLPGPIEAVIAEWRTSVSHGLYLRRLAQVVLALEREDKVVVVGRGAAFVLADPGTTHVRIVAPMPCRIASLVQRRRLLRSEAQRWLEAQDEASARFVRQSFQADVADPRHYDLTLNTAELGPEEASHIILVAAGRKSEHRLPACEVPQDLVAHITRSRRRPHYPRVSEVTWRHFERRSSWG